MSRSIKESVNTEINPMQAHSEAPNRSWWHQTFGEVRTRILLLYALLMLCFTAISIPIFRSFLFANVDNRVRLDLQKEMNSFREGYEAWEQLPDQSIEDLKDYVDRFLAEELPEDDNYFIVLLDGEFYRSSPAALPVALRPGSALLENWEEDYQPSKYHNSANWVETSTIYRKIYDPQSGDILYLIQPLELEGQSRGVFAVVHASGGERAEALEAVYIFGQVAIVIVLITFVLAWLGTGQLLAPMRTLAATARSISETDLNQRIDVQGSGEMAELTDTFNAMMNRIQDSFNSQRNFINDAGHELRTPITIIRGHLELMGDEPEERQETLDLVLDELDRMSRFVNDMILLAKAERPDFLHLETIELNSFAEELFAKAQALADRDWQLKNRAFGTMVGDRQRLTGAIINLAQNATQHTPPNSLIQLGVAVTKSKVLFWVRDMGEGISPSDQERIFERFARAANSYRRSEGAGLGLAIVRAIAEAHGGRIELVSQLGVGSTFTLILPLEPPQERVSQ